MKTRALLVCFATCAALGQQAPEISPDAVFKAATKLVQVSVIVQDQDGKPVADLRRDEFQIFDNGSPQEIRLFVAETEKSNAAPSDVKAPNTLANRIAPSAGGRSGYSILLFDNLTTPFEHTARARLKTLQALQAIPEGDKIAMYSLWCQFQVIREFTTDRESLLRQLDGFMPAAGAACSNGDSDAPPSLAKPGTGMPAVPGRGAGESARIGALRRDSISDEEIQAMVDHLAGIPGRKNLIWLAANFSVSRRALRKLIDAGVAVYPVDAIGSMIGLEYEKKARYAPLLALAAITGGVAFFDRDDLDVGVREALDDGRVSYTLGFYQSRENNRARENNKPGEDSKPTVHQLGVRVSRPGVTLRYRTSCETEPGVPAKPLVGDPVADMVRAMNRPVDATAIGITASATRWTTTSAKGAQGRLELTAKFELSGLDLKLDQGLWKGQAEAVARFMTAEATQAGDTLAETVTFKLRPGTYAAFLTDGLPFRKELSIPAKAVELKLLIGNLASGKIGTLTIPLTAVKEGGANAK